MSQKITYLKSIPLKKYFWLLLMPCSFLLTQKALANQPQYSTPQASLPNSAINTNQETLTVKRVNKPSPTGKLTALPNNVSNPKTAPVAIKNPAVIKNDSLAELDAELARAQKQLASADAQLSTGQRQLQQLETTLRLAMNDSGVDSSGLHPFVRVASRYAGTPYVWGGESRNGFDCSGFIIRVMRDLGYKTLPHSAAEQFNYGMPVAKSLLKPGDLVFFANTYKPGISHVGIFIGKNKFIHAANSRQGTIVSTLNDSYLGPKYAGARRLMPVKS